jgi:hypothetical protein
MVWQSKTIKERGYPMKVKILAVLAVVFMLALVAAWAADVSGKWEAEQAGRGEGAAPTKTTFNFKAAGTALTGTITLPGFMGGEATTVDITEGKIDGNNIQFVVVRKIDMQGQSMEMKSTYKGAVAGDEITFTVERQRPPAGAGGPGGGAPGGGMGAPGGGMGGPGGGAPGGGMGGPGGGAPGGGGGMGAGGGRGGAPQPLIAKRVK